MVDSIPPAQRSLVMSLVKGKNTRPEMIVRKLVFAAGFRYRLHSGKLPGKPDLVFPGRRKVIFVHGCFWHRHENCALARTPKSNHEFWRAKFANNQNRDVANMERLSDLGWSILVVWECELRDLEKVKWRINLFLNEKKIMPE